MPLNLSLVFIIHSAVLSIHCLIGTIPSVIVIFSCTMLFFCSESPQSKWHNWLARCLEVQDAWVWVQFPFQGVGFEFIIEFTIVKFQLIAVEYTVITDINCKLSNQLPCLVTWSLSLKFILCFVFMSGRKQSFVFVLLIYQWLFPAMATPCIPEVFLSLNIFLLFYTNIRRLNCQKSKADICSAGGLFVLSVVFRQKYAS